MSVRSMPNEEDGGRYEVGQEVEIVGLGTEELMEEALRLGYALTSVAKLRREIGQGIARRMVNRMGDFVYQSVAFSLVNFPLSVLENIFPADLMTTNETDLKTWSLTSVDWVAAVLGPLMQDIRMCGGASRALKTKSERWSR